MNFTKQDILKINAALQKLSVKDSAFPVAVSADSSVVFPVLKKGINAQLGIDKLCEYTQSTLNLNNIPNPIVELESATNLYEALYAIYTEALIKGNGGGGSSDAAYVVFNPPIRLKDGTQFINVQSAIEYLIGQALIITYAEDTEIDNIFNN